MKLEAIDVKKDLRGKPFESAIDKLDRQLKQKRSSERMMATILYLGRMDNNNKKKQKSLNLDPNYLKMVYKVVIVKEAKELNVFSNLRKNRRIVEG